VYVEVGRVAKPHGVKGELKVRLHWAESDSLLTVPRVVLRSEPLGEREYVVERARRSHKHVLLKLEGIDSCDVAEQHKAATVLARRDALPALGPGEYYLCDLVGARVHSPAGALGEVVEVRTFPTVDVIVIRRSDGTLVEQPLTEPWLERVDVVAGRVELASTDGLIE
jgi:16S rRNA processing protein RimM